MRFSARAGPAPQREGGDGDSSVQLMLFDLAEIIAYVSSRVELRAGDVLLTGTPSGIGLADGHYLAAGDRVEVCVEGIGSLHNTVIA
jgi:2-keto-4-pentenoate hydratase/2-oxohepta-3-ene-1,7-dioic acid hydratase in catechol pathway